MPKKIKKIINGSLKRSKTISRLMAILIIVDKHIFNNELISLNQAEKFLEEVTSLKTKCKGDERSLQVVDKLQNYMKIIKKEHSIIDTDVMKNNDMYKSFCINDESDCKTPLNGTQTKTNHLKRSNENNIHTLTTTNTNTLEPTSENPKMSSNDSKHHDSKKQKRKEKKLANISKNACEKRTKLHAQKITQCEKNLPANDSVISIKQNLIVDKIIDNMVNNSLDIKEIGSNSNTNPKKRSKRKSKQRSLSWTDNIKLVREICPDEHTDIQIADNFWSDFSLPFILDFDD